MDIYVVYEREELGHIGAESCPVVPMVQTFAAYATLPEAVKHAERPGKYIDDFGIARVALGHAGSVVEVWEDQRMLDLQSRGYMIVDANANLLDDMPDSAGDYTYL